MRLSGRNSHSASRPENMPAAVEDQQHFSAQHLEPFDLISVYVRLGHEPMRPADDVEAQVSGSGI